MEISAYTSASSKKQSVVFKLITIFFQILTNAPLEATTVHLDRHVITSREASDVSPFTVLPTTRGCQTRESHFAFHLQTLKVFCFLFSDGFLLTGTLYSNKSCPSQHTTPSVGFFDGFSLVPLRLCSSNEKYCASMPSQCRRALLSVNPWQL